MNANLPEDYISVDLILPIKKTMAGEARKIIARFYDQDFQSRHVGIILSQSFPDHDQECVNWAARGVVSEMCKKGELLVIEEGSQGRAGVYRNKNA